MSVSPSSLVLLALHCSSPKSPTNGPAKPREDDHSFLHTLSAPNSLGPPVTKEKKNENYQEDNSRYYHLNRYSPETAFIVHNVWRILCL